jgi:hypothetical protein
MQPSGTAAAVIDSQDTEASPTCATCPHPQDTHDVIAARYCAATLAMAITRGCVCKVAPAGK